LAGGGAATKNHNLNATFLLVFNNDRFLLVHTQPTRTTLVLGRTKETMEKGKQQQEEKQQRAFAMVASLGK
jgi:hypothetical protein